MIAGIHMCSMRIEVLIKDGVRVNPARQNGLLPLPMKCIHAIRLNGTSYDVPTDEDKARFIVSEFELDVRGDWFVVVPKIISAEYHGETMDMHEMVRWMVKSRRQPYRRG